MYLHAGGAIGAKGPVPDIEVALPGDLVRFELPSPPGGEDLQQAVRATLRLQELAPYEITIPILGAVYRSVLGSTDVTVHLVGPTGVFKSELAALAQQHFGAALDRLNLPGHWLSTGNALEGLAFAAKDALLVVDDFAPAGTTYDVNVHTERLTG